MIISPLLFLFSLYLYTPTISFAGLDPYAPNPPVGEIHPGCVSRMFYSEGNISLGDPSTLCMKKIATGGEPISLILPEGTAPEAIRKLPPSFFEHVDGEWRLHLGVVRSNLEVQDKVALNSLDIDSLRDKSLAEQLEVLGPATNNLIAAVERAKSQLLVPPPETQPDLHALMEGRQFASATTQEKIEMLRDYISRGADIYRLNWLKQSVVQVAGQGPKKPEEEVQYNKIPFWKGGGLEQQGSRLEVVRFLVEEAGADPNYVHTVRGSALSASLRLSTKTMKDYFLSVLIPSAPIEDHLRVTPDLKLAEYLLSLDQLTLPQDHLEYLLWEVENGHFSVPISPAIVQLLKAKLKLARN